MSPDSIFDFGATILGRLHFSFCAIYSLTPEDFLEIPPSSDGHQDGQKLQGVSGDFCPWLGAVVYYCLLIYGTVR